MRRCREHHDVISLGIRPVVVAPALTCWRALPVVTVVDRGRPGRIARSSHGPWSPSGFYAKCVHGQCDAIEGSHLRGARGPGGMISTCSAAVPWMATESPIPPPTLTDARNGRLARIACYGGIRGPGRQFRGQPLNPLRTFRKPMLYPPSYEGGPGDPSRSGLCPGVAVVLGPSGVEGRSPWPRRCRWARPSWNVTSRGRPRGLRSCAEQRSGREAQSVWSIRGSMSEGDSCATATPRSGHRHDAGRARRVPHRAAHPAGSRPPDPAART